MGLKTNMKKTVAMVCVPGKIRTRLSPDSYYRSRAGFASAEAWNRCRVECDACGRQLSASSLASHLETQHGIFRSKVISRDLLVDGPERTYHAYISAYGVWHLNALQPRLPVNNPYAISRLTHTGSIDG